MKLIFDDPVVSSIEDLKTSLTQGIDEIDHALGDRFQSLELAAWHFNDLKLKVEASVEDLHVEDAARHKTMHLHKAWVNHGVPVRN